MSGTDHAGRAVRLRGTTGRRIVVLGGGGTAVDFAEAALAAGNEVLGFLKDSGGEEPLPVLGAMAEWDRLPGDVLFFCGFGSTKSHKTRLDVLLRLAIPEDRYATIIHPQAMISPSASVNAGSGALAFVSVGARVRIGAHVEILQACIVGHDSRLEDGAILAGGANLAGDVRVGRGAFIGAGACLRNGIRVEAGALVGMNSTVLKDVPTDAIFAGSPAGAIATQAKLP